MAKKWYYPKIITKIINKFFLDRYHDDPKKRDELAHWVGEALKKSDNDHFEYFYTKEFGFDKSYYTNKRILDIGCGPSGTLEWADNALERVGVDPLANDYLKLGARKHKMKYVNSGSEAIPFGNEHFDTIFSFNALDHVDDVDASVKEIRRLLKPGGHFLLITECNHPPRITEPAYIPLDFVEKYFFDYKIHDFHWYVSFGDRIYDTLKTNKVEVSVPEKNVSYILKAHLIKP